MNHVQPCNVLVDYRCEKDFPGVIFAWDIFNEPERVMGENPYMNANLNGLELESVSDIDMQTFVGMCAVGIHLENSRATLGSASMRYCWDNTTGQTLQGWVTCCHTMSHAVCLDATLCMSYAL